MWLRFSWLPAVAGLALLVTGCGGSGGSGAGTSALDQHILKFFNLRTQYASAHQGQAPANTAELKAWAKKLSSQELAKKGIDNSDDVFISPRDGQEYQIAPPPKGAQVSAGAPPAVVVYEKIGVNGMRMVAGGWGEVYEMDEEKFNQVLAGK
jgi:hypothetical protein